MLPTTDLVNAIIFGIGGIGTLGAGMALGREAGTSSTEWALIGGGLGSALLLGVPFLLSSLYGYEAVERCETDEI